MNNEKEELRSVFDPLKRERIIMTCVVSRTLSQRISGTSSHVLQTNNKQE